MVVLKKDKSNSWKIKSRIFWWKHKGERKFEAGFIQCFGYTFWLFRNKDVYNDWPCQA